MSTPGTDELELQLVKSSREIAMVRDALLKKERLIAESKVRNDDLLGKAADTSAESNRRGSLMQELEEQVAQRRKDLKGRISQIQGLQNDFQSTRVDFENQLAEREQFLLTLQGERSDALRVIADHEARIDVLTTDRDKALRDQELAKSAHETLVKRERQRFSVALDDASREQEKTISICEAELAAERRHVEAIRAQERAKHEDMKAKFEIQLREKRERLEADSLGTHLKALHNNVHSRSVGRAELKERLKMAAEELQTRQADVQVEQHRLAIGWHSQ